MIKVASLANEVLSKSVDNDGLHNFEGKLLNFFDCGYCFGLNDHFPMK